MGDNDHAHTTHPLTFLASPASPRIPCISPHILRSAVYVRGYRDGVFQAPRTYYAPLRMYGVTEIASSRRVGSCGSLSSHPSHPPHILRSAAYVRGCRDSVFQTHGGMGSLSSHPMHLPTSPRTYYAPLRMYGVTEMASSRRMGAWALYPHIPAYPRTYSAPLRIYGVTEMASSRHPAQTTLRCVCTGLRR